ncbi:MAG: FAD-dependent monooxygenase, partial [Planctomycetota bacterium]
MKVEIIGGGPGGLYLAILLRRAKGHAVTVHERNAKDDTFGWGVVFSEATLDNLEEADPESYKRIAETFAKWDAVDVHFKGEVVRSGGHGFCGIERKRLLNLLQDRAAELGVDLRYKTEIKDLPKADLVVAADGVNSLVRARHEKDFKPSISLGKSKFVWLGTTRPFEAFTFFSRENEHGFFQVHAYQYDEQRSTFIVECDEETFQASGLGSGGERGTVDYLQQLFKEELHGHPLLTNKSEWINFRTVRNEHWFKGNLVLLGDAARTAHFSIGSGTKLAMEDAICLARCLAEEKEPLKAYEAERKWYSERLQQMADESRRWFETVKLRRHLEPGQFAYSMMTRNKRLGHDQLR